MPALQKRTQRKRWVLYGLFEIFSFRSLHPSWEQALAPELEQARAPVQELALEPEPV